MIVHRIITISVAACLFISCNNIRESSSEIQKTDSVPLSAAVPSAPKMEPPILKDESLNEANLIVKKKLMASYTMDATDYRNFSIKKIDSSAGDENGFIYHIVDTLFLKQGLIVLLIGREYISENIIWLAVYNEEHQLIDRKQVYYDNAEGFLSVETTIKNNELTINTKNDFDEGNKNTTEKYWLTGAGKIIKL